MQDQQVAPRGLQHAFAERGFEEGLGGWEMGEEGAPGANFCFSGALDEDVEVGGE